jgi:DNA (cytosine-5)-methyltransferase 1
VNELALFAGAGGGILGGKLLGWRTVCAVELDAYCRRVLLARQRDAFLPRFPIWDDVQTFDGRPWRGGVDVVSGGFPCTDISVAKTNAKGIDGQQSGLWREMSRIVCEVMPRFVFVENSPALTDRGLGIVLRDLARMGYDARWGVLGAIHTGLPHRRLRIWIVAHSKGERLQVSALLQAEELSRQSRGTSEPSKLRPSQWEVHQPCMAGVDDGVGNWVGRSKAIGNGQCPSVAALAWRLLGGPTHE